MLILILGVALWWAPHLWKRIAPDHRAQFGDKGKGIAAGLLVVSVLLMIWGYQIAQGPVWWGPTGATRGINNLLLLAAFYLYAASGMKTAVTRVTRHPQLIAFSLWAVAHLLVNGDLPSLILFGGLLLWAFAEMALINAQSPGWTPPPRAPVRKEAMAAAGALIVFGLVALVHTWLGYNPFAG